MSDKLKKDMEIILKAGKESTERRKASSCKSDLLSVDDERPRNEPFENAIYRNLGGSHPSDRTGYYTLLRAFQDFVRGDEKQSLEGIEAARKEHDKPKQRTDR